MDAVIDHQHVKRMVEAGFTEEQAEAVASGISDRLATKADWDKLERRRTPSTPCRPFPAISAPKSWKCR